LRRSNWNCPFAKRALKPPKIERKRETLGVEQEKVAYCVFKGLSIHPSIYLSPGVETLGGPWIEMSSLTETRADCY
jgi:hypothetical protein